MYEFFSMLLEIIFGLVRLFFGLRIATEDRLDLRKTNRFQVISALQHKFLG